MALASPGERAESRREAPRNGLSMIGHEGVRGLQALGVRDLSYRLAFIASSVQVALIAVGFLGIKMSPSQVHPLYSLFCIRSWMAGETLTLGIRRRMAMKSAARCSLSVACSFFPYFLWNLNKCSHRASRYHNIIVQLHSIILLLVIAD